MKSLGKQAVSTGSINQGVEIALCFFEYVLGQTVSTPKKFLITPFFQNGRVL